MNKKSICLGTGLVALDVILNGNRIDLPKLSAGGSCGNVLSILSFLDWESYPIARLGNDRAGKELIQDLGRWDIHNDYLTQTQQGSTPIIIHRILKNKNEQLVHKFEFKDPDTKKWLPHFKPITKKVATHVMEGNIVPDVFYFDRMNPGTFELATHYKVRGTIIFFEPTSAKDEKLFEKFLAIADVVKYSDERIPNFRDKYRSITCFLEIETMGKNGLVFRCKNQTEPDQWKSVNGYHIDKIQDTAGAGDWCSAGIIYQLCSGGHKNLFGSTISDVEKASRFGQALGALNCLYDGARGLMYHVSANKAVSTANNLMTSKKISSIKLPSTPMFDISSDLQFSKLYSRK